MKIKYYMTDGHLQYVVAAALQVPLELHNDAVTLAAVSDSFNEPFQIHELINRTAEWCEVNWGAAAALVVENMPTLLARGLQVIERHQ
jgi:hypothetical protein